MGSELVTGRVWSRLSGTRRKSRQRAWVAVAYFGKGAAKLLPLPRGSRLVVDASDNAVKAGQTHPADLLALQAKGVRVFSYPYLHGKIYVFGNVAAIGSANASYNSAQTLLEAMVMTTERRIVEGAKRFVERIAKNELGPDQLSRLQKNAKRSPSGVESTEVRGRRMIFGGRAGTPSAAATRS
jgi:phosphatidylserine/phosphatidylglycerophosphate/cardiolipin synthase-like enzyme